MTVTEDKEKKAENDVCLAYAKEMSIDVEIVAVLSKMGVTVSFSLTFNSTARTEL